MWLIWYLSQNLPALDVFNVNCMAVNYMAVHIMSVNMIGFNVIIGLVFAFPDIGVNLLVVNAIDVNIIDTTFWLKTLLL